MQGAGPSGLFLSCPDSGRAWACSAHPAALLPAHVKPYRGCGIVFTEDETVGYEYAAGCSARVSNTSAGGCSTALVYSAQRGGAPQGPGHARRTPQVCLMKGAIHGGGLECRVDGGFRRPAYRSRPDVIRHWSRAERESILNALDVSIALHTLVSSPGTWAHTGLVSKSSSSSF